MTKPSPHTPWDEKIGSWSREFEADRNGPRHIFFIDWIPPDLYAAIKRKAKRERKSVRYIVLTYLRDWVERHG